MFVKGKDFISTFRIDLGLELGCEKAEDAFIVLREPTTLELMDLQSSTEQARKILDMIPAVLIDHDFYVSENVRMNAQQVAQTIGEKPTVAVKVMGEYVEKVIAPFQKKNERK